MKRPISIISADAFDRAAYSVFVSYEAHAHYDLPPPSAWDRWVYWCRGFCAGLLGDHQSIPLSYRALRWVGMVLQLAQPIVLTRWCRLLRHPTGRALPAEGGRFRVEAHPRR